MAVGTGLSRVTGLVRTMAIAYALGGELLSGTYNLANNTPNVLYDLILGGILAATLVPVMVERFDRDDHEGIDALATVITVGLVGLTVLGMVLSPVIISLYTVFNDDPTEVAAQRAVAVPLLLLFMPQVLFYGLTALWTAILNARRSFAVPAFAPVLNNIVVITMLVALPRVAGGSVTFDQVRDDKGLLALLGLGTTAGIAAMTLVLWPAMRRAGVRLHWNPDWRNPALRTVARLSAWTLGYVAANQVVFLVMLALLNGLPDDGEAVAAYSFAWQFFQLPVGLFTVSIMTTFTPELARHATQRALGPYRERFTQGLRLSLLVVLPTTTLFLVMATPIITVLLQWGAFDADNASTTASALAWLALGLPGFTVFLFTMRGFYAFKDTRTPFWLNLGECALQLTLSFAFAGPFGLQGILAAFSVSYLAVAIAAVAVLHRRVGGFGGTGVAAGVARQAAAAATAGLVLFAATRVVDFEGKLGDLADVVLATGVTLVVYLGVLVALRADDLTLIRSLRPGAGAPSPDSSVP